MSYTFSRRDFLKYSALTAVAVAGAGLLSGCEVQDPNNPVFKKIGVGGTLGTTGGCLDGVKVEGNDGVFTFSIKNGANAPLLIDPTCFSVKVLDAEGKSQFESSYYSISIRTAEGNGGVINQDAGATCQYKITVAGYGAAAPTADDTMTFKYIPRYTQSEYSMNWEISGADLVDTAE